MTGSAYVLAIDQGTTSTRAILFDATGEVRRKRAGRADPALPAARLGRARSRRDLAQRGRRPAARPRPRPTARSPRSASPTSARRPSCGSARPAGRCTTRSSGRTGAPPNLCARWQQRGAGRNRGAAAPGLSSTPISRPRRSAGCSTTVPGLRRRAEDGEIAFGTIDSFLLWRLTGGKRHATDVTNAARTMLFDIRAARLGRGTARRVRDPARDPARGAATPAPISALTAPGDCSAPRSRSRRSPATSRRR